MKTVSQHNADVEATRRAISQIRNAAGVCCDKCGREMQKRPSFVSEPANIAVICPGCGHRDWMKSP